MDLTGRQKDFLSKFLGLYQKYQKPLHYTLLAERLGVSKITAYDMLRLLEKRGLVRSEYVLPTAGQGPGRSSIMFSPAAAAHAFIADLAGDEWDDAEWEEAKDDFLKGLRDKKGVGYEGLLDDILARLPKRQKPLLFAADMVAGAIVSVLQFVDEARIPPLVERVFATGLPGEVSLNRLSGLALGVSLVDRTSQEVSQLISHVDRYQKTLMRLSEENKDRLASFAREVLQVLQG